MGKENYADVMLYKNVLPQQQQHLFLSMDKAYQSIVDIYNTYYSKMLILM